MSDPLWPRPTVTGQAPVWEAESETVSGQAPIRESAVRDTAEGVSVRHTPDQLGKLYYLREELLPWYPLGCRARRAGSVDRGRVRSRPAVSVDRREPVCLAPGQR